MTLSHANRTFDGSIRAVSDGGLPFLWSMLWEAAAVDAGVRALGMDAALALPTVHKYLEGWGRSRDFGLVAIGDDGRQLGAAWWRLFAPDHGSYGFVADDVPEITLGVLEEARGRGVGTALLRALVEAARIAGYRALSLSVDRRNPARRVYERIGFHDAGISSDEDSSVTMILELGTSAVSG